MPIKAVQQFQLGTVLNNETQAIETLALMKQAGYQGIELCGFMIHPTPFLVKLLTKAAGMPVGNGGNLDWQRLVKEADLQVPSVHQYLGAIEEKPEELAEEAAAFGAKYITVTGMYRFDYGNATAVHDLVARLNKAGEALKKQGIDLLYHNHNAEFQRCEPGKTAYDILVEKTDVGFELDSYWAIDAGVDALSLMKRIGSRMKLWHINDRGSRGGNAVTPILKQDSMELDTGNIDLIPLMAQAKEVNVDAVILESHKNWLEGSPIKSFQKSAEFLNQHL